jgi:hypothetical protein
MARVKNVDKRLRGIPLSSGRTLGFGEQADGVDVEAEVEAAWIANGALLVTDGTSAPPIPTAIVTAIIGVAEGWDADHYFPPEVLVRDEGILYVSLQGSVNRKPAANPGYWFEIDSGVEGGIGIPLTQKGAANGVATLDGTSRLTGSQLPASVATAIAAAIATAEGASDVAGTAATDSAAILAQKGAANGIATLDGGERLPAVQLPSSAVSDSRGSATGDLLLFDGASFVRIPRGAPGEQMVVGLDGTVRYQPATSLNLDAIIAEGVTPTEALEKANAAFAAAGGGKLVIGGGAVKEYTFKKMVLQTGVKWIAPAGPRATVIKQEVGVAEPLVQSAVGPVQNTEVDGLSFVPNEQGYALLLEALEDPVKKTGGLFENIFRNCLFGRSSSPAEMAPVWLRGSPTNASLIHQFVYFKNCTFYRANTGANANKNRCIKITGRCEKIFADEQCIYNGSTAQEKVGTNIEIGREFSSPTALTAEAAAGATRYTAASVAGIEAGKIVRVGEGATADTRKVKEVVGKEIVLTLALAFTHAVGENSYLLAGENAPSFIGIRGTSQNCYLNAYVDKSLVVSIGGKTPMDMEYATRGVRVVEESWHFSGNVRPLNVSEGTSNGTGTATVGSNIITEATGEWANGNIVNGRGISGLEVTNVTGGAGALTLTLSDNVAANGTTGAQSISLVKGGKGEGYIYSFENNSLAEYEYHPQGAIDRTVIADATSSATPRNLTRGAPLQVITTSGLTPVITAEGNVLKVGKSREVILGSGAAIKTVYGQHGVGEELTLRAPSTTLIENVGNITIPSGGKMTLAAGDAITLRRQDHAGTLTWIVAGVVRAQEELEGAAFEAINEHLGTPAGFAAATWAIKNGRVYLDGHFEATAEIPASTKLCGLPAAAHPESKHLLLPAVTSVYTTITVATNGELVAQAIMKSGAKMGLSGINFPLKP